MLGLTWVFRDPHAFLLIAPSSLDIVLIHTVGTRPHGRPFSASCIGAEESPRQHFPFMCIMIWWEMWWCGYTWQQGRIRNVVSSCPVSSHSSYYNRRREPVLIMGSHQLPPHFFIFSGLFYKILSSQSSYKYFIKFSLNIQLLFFYTFLLVYSLPPCDPAGEYVCIVLLPCAKHRSALWGSHGDNNQGLSSLIAYSPLGEKDIKSTVLEGSMDSGAPRPFS